MPFTLLFSDTWIIVGKLCIHFFFFFNQMLTPNSTFWSQNNLSVEFFNLKVLSYWSYICSRTLLHTENYRHS